MLRKVSRANRNIFQWHSTPWDCLLFLTKATPTQGSLSKEKSASLITFVCLQHFKRLFAAHSFLFRFPALLKILIQQTSRSVVGIHLGATKNHEMESAKKFLALEKLHTKYPH